MSGNNATGLTSVIGILLIWATLIFGVRIWVKTRLRTVDFWGPDDTSVSLSFVIAILHVATLCNAISHGYGSRWSELTEPARSSVQKSLYASQILYVCCMGCTRLSACFFTDRLSRHRRHQNLSHVWTAGCLIIIIASALVIAIRGNISQPWATLEGTKTLYWRWLGVEVAGLAIDISGFASASILVWGLHMPANKRLMVSMVFLTRLLVTPFIVLRLQYLHPESNADRDEPNVMANIFTEACMHLAFILASMTCLKPFLRPFHSGHLITTADTKMSGYKTGHRGPKSSEYVMLSTAKDTSSSKPAVTVSVADSPSTASTQPAPPPRAFVPDSHGSYRSTVMRQERLNSTSDSEQMIISKTQTWTVEYEDRSRRDRAAAPNARSSTDEVHEDTSDVNKEPVL